jgi:hypothetical protein
MCTDARQLFQGGQDDNLTSAITDEENLWTLAEWSEATKMKKLSRVTNSLARNMLSQMLNKSIAFRPTISRLLVHPFISQKSVARLVGEEAAFDVFLSYRVASDASHAERIYNLLSEKGLKVWWDKKCLKAGEDWEQGFCAGLVSSRTFVCLLSPAAIFTPENPRMNFTLLSEDSACDNVFLEHRLAMELHEMGLIQKVFPVMIGEFDAANNVYQKYTARYAINCNCF